MNLALSPLFVHIPLFYREHYILSFKYIMFIDNDDVKAVAIPRVFSENSQAKNVSLGIFFLCMHVKKY